MNPLISIIVPVYNVEKYLRIALDSIANQTYKNLEIIVVDDGSTDSSGQICDEYADKDSRFVVIHQKNRGVSAARNAALRKCTGQYLYFIDSDDFIEPHLCERALTVLLEQQADIVWFNMHFTDENGNLLPGSVEKLQNGLLDKKAALTALAYGNINSYSWNKLYRAELFKEIRFPEAMIWEDVAVMHRILLCAERIYMLDEHLYFYRQRNNSIVGKMNVFSLECIFTAQKTRYYDLLDIYPDIAEILFPLVALSCIRLYDRSLWQPGKAEILHDAKEFLKTNKERILSSPEKHRYSMYFKNTALYNIMRRTRHLAGNIVRTIKK